MNSVRHFIGISSLLILTVVVNGQVKPPPTVESDVYTIKEFAVSHSWPASFSIGYPKGWTKTEVGWPQIGELLAADDPLVVTFSSYSVATSRATITIWRTYAASAENAAADFATSVRQ